jgi:hypothetical protein
MRILGSTIDLIAANKAGIFKEHIPALIGPECPHEVMNVLWPPSQTTDSLSVCSLTQSIAQARHIPLTSLPTSLASSSQDKDQLNTHLALTGLSLLRDYLLTLPSQSPPSREFPLTTIRKFESLDLQQRELVELIFSCRPPYRWQEIGYTRQVDLNSSENGGTPRRVSVRINLVLDIAHNQPAIEALMEKVKRKFSEEERRTKIRFVHFPFHPLHSFFPPCPDSCTACPETKTSNHALLPSLLLCLSTGSTLSRSPCLILLLPILT